MSCKIAQIICVLGAIVVAGCSQEEDWYDRSSAVDDRKQESIERIMRDQGVSEAEASRQWNSEYWREQTEVQGTREPVESYDSSR